MCIDEEEVHTIEEEEVYTNEEEEEVVEIYHSNVVLEQVGICHSNELVKVPYS